MPELRKLFEAEDSESARFIVGRMSGTVGSHLRGQGLSRRLLQHAIAHRRFAALKKSSYSETGMRFNAKNYLIATALSVGACGSLRRAAIFTWSGNDSAFIFRIALPRCFFTVISLIPRRLPTCLFKRPTTTRAITSRCASCSFDVCAAAQMGTSQNVSFQ
jgi:predicted GNAT family acetyltransferase